MTSRITSDIEYVAYTLLDAGIAGIPTETVYGLAADFRNENAVQRVFTVKGRPTHHPLIVHLATSFDIEKFGHFNTHAIQLFEAFSPGPITLLVPRTPLIPDWVTGGRDTVALRFPSHQIAQQLLENVDTGLVAPSANKFGRVSPTTAQHVIDDLQDEVDVVLDGGPCTIGIESTIVECIGDTVQVLRPGAITAAEIASAIDLPLTLTSGESRAPGMLLSHYAPLAKVYLEETPEDAESRLALLRDEGHKVSLLYYADPLQFAMNLYDELRRADVNNMDCVVALLPDDEGIGHAVRDRLKKAAATT